MPTEDQGRWAAEGLEVIRREEELRATVTAVPYERVRVVKRIVTETVSIEVQLRREELVVEHLPRADTPEAPASAAPASRSRLSRAKDSALSRLGSRAEPPQISNETVDVVLLEEQYEVVKRTVPRERVRLTRMVQTAQAPVMGTVRKEQVDVDQVPLDGHVG